MKEWKDAGRPIGKYWVWDDDGWFYWAEPLEPEQATGLLLDEVVQKNYMSDTNYYAINVVGQFASANDWGEDGDDPSGFYKDGISDDAKDLFDEMANIVTGEDGKKYADCGYNTYRELLADGTKGDLICAGKDLKIGNEDDKTNVIKLDSELVINGDRFGKVFLTPDGSSSSYWAMGSDKLLGTDDDVEIQYSGSNFPKGSDSDFIVTGNYRVRINELSGATKVEANDTLEFTAQILCDGTPIADQSVKWMVTGGKSGTQISADGKLTVDPLETAGAKLRITVTSKENCNWSEIYVVTVEGPDSVTVRPSDQSVVKGKTLQMSAVVKKGDAAYASQKVTWDVDGNTSSDTKIDENGLLTVGSSETSETLAVIATSVNKKSVSGSQTVSVKTPLPDAIVSTIESITPGSSATVTVTIDGIEFYVLARQSSKALLLTKDVVRTSYSFCGTNYNQWSGSKIRTWLNDTWLPGLSILKKDMVVSETTIYTVSTYNDTSGSSFYTTSDYAFLLSEADVFGTQNGTSVSNSKYYTTGSQLSLSAGWRITNYWWYLRSPRNSAYEVPVVTNVGASSYASCYHTHSAYGVRPALWVYY